MYSIPNFEVVACHDVQKTKPDPEGISKLLKLLHIDKHETIILGDHPVDMKAAKAAGVYAIGMSHGFGTPAELIKAGAICILDSLTSLPQIIDDHNSGKKLLF